MSESKKTLAKINVGPDGDYFLLSTVLGEDAQEGFDLALSDGKDGWSGSLDENDLETLSQEVKIDYEEYVSQTRKAFSRTNMGSLNFVYQIKKQKDGSVLLIWKKHMLAENVKFQLGSVKLKAVRDPATITVMIFNEAISVNAEMQATMTTLVAEKERMESERLTALKRLEKYANLKEEIENDLYSKFVVVVNHKKAKIRELKAEVDDLRKGIPMASTSLPVASTSRGTKAQDETKSDDSEENMGVPSDYDTDEEEASVAPKKRTNKSTKIKAEPMSQDDDSLMLDTGDDATVATGKRRRRQPTAKKTSPARTVLPKVTTTPKTSTPSSSRGKKRVSMRKSTSNTSNVSSDRTEPDDLIDDMF